MGRPLTGSLRQQGGRWWASVPVAKGATERHECSFLTEDDARAWLAQAVIAVHVGKAVPEPQSFRTAKPKPRPKSTGPPKQPVISPDVASVAQAWMTAAYDDLRRGGPERAERVRRLVEGFLVPWFAPRTTTIADVTYFMAHEWLLHLVGREQGMVPRSTSRPSIDATAAKSNRGEFGLAEAAVECGVSLPTMRRRWHAGALPGAYRDEHGHVRVPSSALKAVRTRGHQPVSLSQSYVSDALWVLRKVLSFARANGFFAPGFDPTEGLDAPAPNPTAGRVRRPTGQTRPLTLPECARIASHLHVPHQMVFWLQRIMGLRISEAFGLLVGDLVDLGDSGMLAVQGQGGRIFNVRDDSGSIVAVPYKATLKTAAGSRVLVAPGKLMELLRVAIEAFHTDPDSGGVDLTDRLVPGIRIANASGQQGYQAALEDAVKQENLSSDDLGFRVSSHLLRKSLATDLAWHAGIEDAVRRRFMGHRAGEDVFGRIYTLDHPEVTPFVEVAAMLNGNIANSIGTLMTPTTRPVHWGPSNPLVERADHVDATLGAAGWLIDPGGTDDPLCSMKRAAAELGMELTTVRRWMLDGTLPVVMAPDAHGVPRRWIRLSAVWAVREHRAGRVLLPDVAEEFGVTYHQLLSCVHRLGLVMEQDPATKQYEVTEEVVAALRIEHKRIADLHERSMKMATAARQLRLALSTVGVMARNGEIEIDPETDGGGARFVTKASVHSSWLARAPGKRRLAQVARGIPLAEVVRFTGMSKKSIVDLLDTGVFEQSPTRKACEITTASLERYLANEG